MKKKKIILGKLSLGKESIIALSKVQQDGIGGGEQTQTTCQCPTPSYTLDFYCPNTQHDKNSCVNCIRTLLNEKTENLCY